MAYLRNEHRVRNEVFGYRTQLLSAEEVREQYCDERDAAGAMLEQEGVGSASAKFTFGIMRRARQLGGEVPHCQPGAGLGRVNGVHHLRTPGGIVRARRGGRLHRRLHRADNDAPAQEQALAHPLQLRRHAAFD
jgi:glycine/D-amino acid oxidase-like deaminating enzyme